PAQRMEQIARLLETGPVPVRRAAAVRMGASVPADSRLAEVARAQLSDSDPLIRSCAALALGGTGAEAATEQALLEMLDSGDPSQLIPALGAIGRMPVVSRQVHETVMSRQQTGIPGVDILAATVVAGVEPSDSTAITTLVRAAGDESPEVRTLALRALQLTRWREHEGADACVRARSGDENLRVRAAAEQTLATPEVQPVAYEEVASSPQVEGPGAAESAPAPVDDGPGRAVISAPPSSENEVPERRFSERRTGEISATLGPIQMPGELSPRQMLSRPGLFHQLGAVRGNPELVCLWTPPLVRHQPLYFEEVSLERYGYHYGCVQSVISGAKFGANVALLPLKVIGQPPCSTEYSVGYERPGNCAEAVCDGIRLCTPDECDDGPEDTIIPQYQVCP
ncbi:MAG: HEAT repeat domain-containing protein, partial [Planctomycetaceae bacterium]